MFGQIPWAIYLAGYKETMAPAWGTLLIINSARFHFSRAIGDIHGAAWAKMELNSSYR